MAAAVITATKPTGLIGYSDGNRKVRYFDITSDTGDYPTGGFTLTATQLGFRKILHAQPDGFATQGTAGASAVGIGITYVATGVNIQLYESAGSGSPPAEKGAEAMVANFIFRLRVEGR